VNSSRRVPLLCAHRAAGGDQFPPCLFPISDQTSLSSPHSSINPNSPSTHEHAYDERLAQSSTHSGHSLHRRGDSILQIPFNSAPVARAPVVSYCFRYTKEHGSIAASILGSRNTEHDRDSTIREHQSRRAIVGLVGITSRVELLGWQGEAG
jgi:hypothetical protein